MCNAINVPGQNFTWMKRGKSNKINNDEKYSVVSTTGSSQLTIKNISVADRGRYTCDGTTNIDQPCQATIYLQVNCKFDFTVSISLFIDVRQYNPWRQTGKTPMADNTLLVITRKHAVFTNRHCAYWKYLECPSLHPQNTSNNYCLIDM